MNNCQASYSMMLSDVSPGGQYASTDPNSENRPLSLFSYPNYLPRRYAYQNEYSNFRLPMKEIRNQDGTYTIVPGDFLDEEGNVSYIPVSPLVESPATGEDYEPRVYFANFSQEQVVKRVRQEGEHYVEDPYGDILAVKPQYIYEHDEFRSHWKPSWANSLVFYHPEYCYYESCRKNSERNSSLGYSSNDFDDRIQFIETYADAIIAQEETVSFQPNPLYDSRFTAALITDEASDIEDLLDKDPYFALPGHSTLKDEILLRLQQYKVIPNTNPVQHLNLKEFAAIAARCGSLFYANMADLNALGCKDFGSGNDDDIKDHEYQTYVSTYLSIKQEIQMRESDKHCLSTDYNPGYNGCIGNDNYNPYSNSLYFNAGSWHYAYRHFFRQPCSWPSWWLYKDKVKRFVKKDDLPAQGDQCEVDSPEEAIRKMKNKARLEHYMETGQCPLALDLQSMLDQMAAREAITFPGAKSLVGIPGFTKALYDYFAFGAVDPIEPNAAGHVRYNYSISLNALTADDDTREYTISGTQAGAPFGTDQGHYINLSLTPHNFEYYKEQLDPADDEIFAIPLNFNSSPSGVTVMEPAFNLPVGTNPTPVSVSAGRFRTQISGFRNLVYTMKTLAPNQIDYIYSFTAEAIVDIYDDQDPQNPMLAGTYSQLKISGTTDIIIGDCDFSEVCLLSQEMEDVKDLLSGMAANTHLNSAVPIELTDAVYPVDPANPAGNHYEALFTPLLRSHARLASDYSFTSSAIGSGITINIVGSGNMGNDFTISLTAVQPTDLTKIISFTCIHENPNGITPADFLITALVDEGNGNMGFADFTGTIAACSTCTAFETLKCGPPLPERCETIAHGNKDHVLLFIDELVRDHSTSSGNFLFYNNGLTTQLSMNTAFMTGLFSQLEAGDYYLRDIAVTNNSGVIDNNGTRLTASICIPVSNACSGNSCSLVLEFDDKPSGITFENIIGFAGLKADYTTRSGTNTYGFTVFAICKVPGSSFPVNLKMTGSSCFPIENCEMDCYAGRQNLVVNGDFSDPTLLSPPGNCTECECIVTDNTWTTHPKYPSFPYPRYTSPYFGSDYCLLNEWDNFGWGGAMFTRKPADSGLDWDGEDHTDGKGFFLYTDNRYQEYQNNPRLWYQTIQVEPGQTYEYTAWAINLHQADNPEDTSDCTGCLLATDWEDNNDPNINKCPYDQSSSVRKDVFQLKLRVSDAAGNILQEISSGDLTCKNGWQKTSFFWTNSSNMEEVVISIINPADYFYGGDAGIDDISFSRVCPPSGPIFPVVSIDDDACEQHLTDVATMNGVNNYHRYLIQQTENFKRNYLEKCLKPLEHLEYSYEEREFHYTLYYYDQAGNLVKTVPPAGVDSLTVEELDVIKQDRWYKTFTLDAQPEHTLATTYTYNSLNQLVAQSVPDNENMEIWEANSASTNVNPAYSVVGVQFRDASNGYLIANDPSGTSHIYVTDDGGDTWIEISKVGISDLTDVQFITSSKVYAIGKDGVFLLSDNAGASWQVKSIADITSPLVRMHFTGDQNGIVYEEDGTIWVTGNGGDTWNQSITSVPVTGNLKDVDINGIYGFAVSADASRGYVYACADGGLTWTLQNEFRANDLTALYFVPGAGGKGYIAGDNGTLLESSDNGQTWQIKASTNFDGFREIHYKNNDEAVAITSGGGVSRTINGGTDWAAQSFPSDNFADIYFTSTDNGFAVSRQGNLFKTTNAGSTWTSAIPVTPATSDLTAVFFHDANNGFAAGENLEIYQTTSGGTGTWTSVAYNLGSLTTGDIRQVHFADAARGCVLAGTAGSEKIYFTENLNSTDPMNLPVWGPATGAFSYTIVAFDFVSPDNGYALASDGTVLYSTTAGKDWSVMGAHSSLAGFTALHFKDGTDEGYFAGPSGKIFITTDGGATIQDKSSITPLGLSGISRVSSADGYAAGENGAIYRFASGTWNKQSTPVRENLNEIHYASSSVLVAAGEQAAIRTTDGSTWSLMALPPSLSGSVFNAAELAAQDLSFLAGNGGDLMKTDHTVPVSSEQNTETSLDLLAVDFFDNQKGVAVGKSGTIVITGDGGSAWNNMTSIQPLKLNATYMLPNSTSGYAVGAGGAIVKTDDGGLSWNAVNSPVTTELTGVFFTGTSSGVITGKGGKVYYTHNGGSSWSPSAVSPAVSADLTDIYFSGNLGVIVGSNGTILTTDNGGSSWTNRTLPAMTAGLTAVFIVAPNTVYTVGNGGVIRKSGDGGATWSALQDEGVNWTTKNLADVYFSNPFIGYAVGEDGTLLKTVNKGLSWLTQDAGTGTSTDMKTITFAPDGVAYIGGANGGSSNVTKLKDQRDLYSSRFWYDELGRLVASQNSKQFNFPNKKSYSYTRYDALGRIMEVGEVLHTQPLDDELTGTQILTVDFESWLTHADAAKRQITRTWYDTPLGSVQCTNCGYTPSQFKLEDFTQENLRKRVAAITYQEADGDAYDNASHYSYDIHGNVKTLIQEYPKLWTGMARKCSTCTYEEGDQRIKRIDYVYDLVSGNVHEVKFQEGYSDQFYHRYHYDSDNRITEVFTSADEVVWEKDAKYFYYNHGPLARTEIGEHKVQGMDYAYTIQGWIKGVNSNTLITTRDIGKDGNYAGADLAATSFDGAQGYISLHKNIAVDEYGYTLGYFEGDYASVASLGTGTEGFEASKAGSGYAASIKDLYNGNISSMVTAIGQLMGTEGAMGMAYGYDQLNRLKTVRMHKGIDAGNQWLSGGTARNDYAENFTYDPNGNILKASRNAHQAAYANADGTGLDSLQYIYETIGNGYEKNTNKLRQVIDLRGATTIAGDLEPGQVKDNYDYDEIGNLIADEQEHIAGIEWTVYGKVKKVTRKDYSGQTGNEYNKPDLEFLYDASGNRIVKIMKPRSNGLPGTQDQWEYTYYVRDASGNVMATYTKNFSGTTTYTESLVKDESHLYGSSRVGIRRHEALTIATRTFEAGINNATNEFENIANASTPQNVGLNSGQFGFELGWKSYELSNHLGNVLVVVSDKKLQVDSDSDGDVDKFTAEVLSAQNYYAFGAEMDGEKFTGASGSYKYGFNGKEKDSEWNSGGAMYDYGFRIYDPRIAKFLSVDPLRPKYPELTPYQFAGNDPVNFIDLDGLEKATPEQQKNALKMIDDFANDKSQSKTVWTKISKQQFFNDLKAVISNPNSITQGNNPLCGIASAVKTAAEYDPENLVKMAISLYTKGSAASPHWYVINNINADSDLYNEGNTLYEQQDINGLNSAEFILGTSIRNTFNLTGYNNDGSAPQGSARELINNIQGITLPGEVSKFLEQYFDIKQLETKSSSYTTQIDMSLRKGHSLIALTSWNELKYKGSFDLQVLHYVHVTGLSFNAQTQLYNLKIWNPQTGASDDFDLTYRQMNTYILKLFKFY